MTVERFVDSNNVVRIAGRLVPAPAAGGAVVSAVDPGPIGAGLLWFDTSSPPGTLLVRDATNTAWLAATPPAPTSLADIDLAARNLLSESFSLASAANDFVPDLLGAIGSAVPLRAGMSVAGVAYFVDNFGPGFAPAHFDVAMYQLDGTQLAVSVDDAAKWGPKPDLGIFSTLFPAPVDVLADDDYYLTINFVQGAGRGINFATNSFETGAGVPYKTGAAPGVNDPSPWPSPSPAAFVESDQRPWVAAVSN